MKKRINYLRFEEPVDLDALEEIRRGAGHFRRALELARYIGHHAKREMDWR